MLTRALFLTVPLFLLTPAAAQIADPQDGAARVRSAWSEYQAAEASYHVAAAQARRALDAAARVDRNTARRTYLEAIERPQQAMTSQQLAFYRALAEVGYEELDFEADAALLTGGLAGAARELTTEDPVRAIDMYEALLVHYPDAEEVTSVRRVGLWKAQVAAGRCPAAIAAYQRFAAAVDDPVEALCLRTITGDLQAIEGDVGSARETWRSALADVPATEDRAVQRVRSDLERRVALIGVPAPEFAADIWIGEDGDSLTARRGRVVVVDFWATWCAPCRTVMPELSALYQARHEDDLDVIGVTRFYANGYLPANPEQLRAGGESVEEMDAGTFRQHLVDFRRNAGIAYPFAIGKQADFEAYQVSGIPMLAIIDRQGYVAMVVVGSGNEMVVRAVVDRLLGEKRD